MNFRRVYQRFTFDSAKCRRPIPFVAPLLRDHLIQLSLDGEVAALDYVEATVAGPIEIAVRLVVAYRSDGGFVQEIGPERPAAESSRLREIAAVHGLAVETVDPRDIMAEPRLGAARAIWAKRGRRVDVGTRFALLDALAAVGPMRLLELCTRVPGPADPVEAVASLACAGAIHLDLSESFGPHTIVRSKA
jgi:hypothetical protein